MYYNLKQFFNYIDVDTWSRLFLLFKYVIMITIID